MNRESFEHVKREIDDLLARDVKPGRTLAKNIALRLFSECGARKPKTAKKSIVEESELLIQKMGAAGWFPQHQNCEKDNNYWEDLWGHCISKTKSPNIADTLCKCGGKPWHITNTGSWSRTAIGQAVFRSADDIVDVLVRHMDESIVASAMQQTPAWQDKFLSFIDGIENHGKISEQTAKNACEQWKRNGWSPDFHELESLAQHGSEESLRLALSFSEHVKNMKDKQGSNLLHRIVSGTWTKNDKSKVAKINLLLNAGIDPMGKDELGNCPIDVARAHLNKEALEILTPIHQASVLRKSFASEDKDNPKKLGETVTVNQAIRTLLNKGYAIMAPDGTPVVSESPKRQRSKTV